MKTKDIQDLATGGMISDIIDEGLPATRKRHRLLPTRENIKICGRIKTLTLKEGPAKSISVDKIFNMTEQGDVLVIRGNKEWAYWGKVMSNFAILKGLAGTVIFGCSRDKWEVASLPYNVFASEYYGLDIKGRGYVASIDEDIEYDSVIYRPNDYLFIDQELIATIPRDKIDNLHARVITMRKQEDSIVEEIFNTKSIDVLVREHNL